MYANPVIKVPLLVFHLKIAYNDDYQYVFMITMNKKFHLVWHFRGTSHDKFNLTVLTLERINIYFM
ncbi:MAG: hypothetical protein HQ534_06655 [Armatimonadetes bacterium]|nr:hypothetical protein [Armatimonadota bacterium]